MPQLTPDDVQQALESLGLDVRVQHFETSTATAQEAADSIGTELGTIVKSLCFMVGGEPVIVLGAGDHRIDDRKLAALYDVSRKKVKIADAQTTLQTTGYLPGGVPPVGHLHPLPVLIDDTLGRFELVYAAAGSPNAIFPIPFETLCEITGGRVVDLAKA